MVSGFWLGLFISRSRETGHIPYSVPISTDIHLHGILAVPKYGTYPEKLFHNVFFHNAKPPTQEIGKSQLRTGSFCPEYSILSERGFSEGVRIRGTSGHIPAVHLGSRSWAKKKKQETGAGLYNWKGATMAVDLGVCERQLKIGGANFALRRHFRWSNSRKLKARMISEIFWKLRNQ